MNEIKLSYKDNARYFNPIRKAILNYEMIRPNEKVAIGMSGGKDSTSLLFFLDELKRHKRLGFDFEIVPICLDMGLPVDITPMKEFVENLGYTLEIVPTNIMEVVFDIRKERSPCSLCAKLRRGILYSRAKELGCSKVALGHHLDDAIETHFMNFFFHGQMGSFDPISYLSKTDISLIRPMVYVAEGDIIQFVKRQGLPVIQNPCPVDKHTKREEIKHVVTQLSTSYPDVRQKFIMAMEKGETEVFWKKLKKV
ncbi:tRNA(Ile)-lysidine synthase TilS/MesJ [Pilibacter termitis]|uniref:tRNA(Ile)-lysidine synthase TilS/MesJ n=1 Tax=Pilibacter termitis TaxID=263852 RepID=A0A1T4L2R9_9ENTE|nr:ATP-binding protein [Pilibacter termitis]SJZ48827.1 tRNA(Ile)-lysidine synthase TilS/MesJ [Pilibacter termitis]